MNRPFIDWNDVWKKTQEKKHAPTRDPKFWDKRAPEFARHASSSDYIGQFIAIMKPESYWSVLDIGCAAGTLAIPLSPSVRSITALDRSSAMLSLLEERCHAQARKNIRIINGRWEDDWESLGIGKHDVVIASRSLILDDLREAIGKLMQFAGKRIYISTLVDDGPHDRAIIEAVGRKFNNGPDYIVVYNLLRDMGIYANVSFTINREVKLFTDLDDAVDAMRWMLHEMTPEEEILLRGHLQMTLIKENGYWKLPYRRTVRWAVLWWDIEDDRSLEPNRCTQDIFSTSESQ